MISSSSLSNSSSSNSSSSSSSSSLTGGSQQEKHHNWTKKHFSHPPYCYICNTLICNVGKLAYYCTICHLTSHIECNANYKSIPGFCSIVKHDWIRDRFDNSPTCSGCSNIVFSPKDKASGYYCTKCSLKSHKNCRNLSPKCEPISKSLFSIVKQSFDSSLNLSSIGNLGGLATNSNNSNNSNNNNNNQSTTTLNLNSISKVEKEKEKEMLSPKGGNDNSNSSCTIQSTNNNNNQCINNNNNNSNSNSNSPTTTCQNIDSPTTISSPINLNSPNTYSCSSSNQPISPKSTDRNSSSLNQSTIIGGTVQWTLPDNPSTIRPTSLTKSYDPSVIMLSNNNNNNNNNNSNNPFINMNNTNSTNNLMKNLNYINHSSVGGGSVDTLVELDGITFNPSGASNNQKLLFVERMKSFFVGLSMKMDSNYDLSSPCRNNINHFNNPNNNNNYYSIYGDGENLQNFTKFRSIQHIFHHDMLNFGKYRSQMQIDVYRKVIEIFLQLYSSTSWEEEYDFILRIALDFYSFLNTHKKDPENVLIGMTPSKDIQRRVKKYFYNNQNNNQNNSNNSSSSNLLNQSQNNNQNNQNNSNNSNLMTSMMMSNTSGQFNSTSNLLKHNSRSSNQNNNGKDLRVSRPSLIDHITSWSQIDDKDALLKMVREFSIELEKEKLSTGDIVIVKLPKSWSPMRSDKIVDPNHHEFDEGSFIFARYSREADALGINCFVHLLPDETAALCIPHSRLVTLEMIGIAVPADRSKMDRLITNPFDAYSTELRTAVKEITKHKLRDIGLDVDIISQSLNFNGHKCVSIDELSSLKSQICAFSNNDVFLSDIDSISFRFSQYFCHYLKKVYMNESKGNHQLYFSRDHIIDFQNSLIFDYNNLFQLNQNQNNNNQNNNNNNNNNQNQNQFENSLDLKETKYYSMIKKQYTKFKPFLSNIKSLISDLEAGRVVCLKAKDSLQGLITECDLAIDTIGSDNVRLLDGSKKKELTSWWLRIVGETVISYLSDRGFDPCAVPDNYIDERPASLSIVKENLRIVNSVLKPSTQNDIEHRLNHLIQPLKFKIYHRIDQFLLSAENLLFDKIKKNKKLFLLNEQDNLIDLKLISDGLKIDRGESSTSLLQSFNEQETSLINVISNLIEDVLYIREMKNLEERFYNNDVLLEVSHPMTNEKFSLSNIVPITGLIFSRLLRIKHELRTVLEVHGDKIMTRSLFPNVVHNIIIGKKLDDNNNQ